MRRERRRRPAGESRVPAVVVEPTLVVWRLGPYLELWDQIGATVATIWRRHDTDCWYRAAWPHEATATPVAPRDLSVGHILEVAPAGSAAVQYACVVAVHIGAVVVYLGRDCGDAERASRYVVAEWQESHLERALQQFPRNVYRVHGA